MACFHVAYTSFPCGVDNAYLNHSSLVKYECLFLMQIYFSLKFNKTWPVTVDPKNATIGLKLKQILSKLMLCIKKIKQHNHRKYRKKLNTKK